MTPAGWLAVFLAGLAAERWFELDRSRRNTQRMKARGAVESGAAHFGWLVALHAIWPVALVLEVTGLGSRPPRLWPLALTIWTVAQVLRASSMAALGERWNVRILVIPGELPVRSGIYRWLRHPNYVAVVLELIAAPLLFGAWRTAAGASLLNAVILPVRIRAEERALEEGATTTLSAGS